MNVSSECSPLLTFIVADCPPVIGVIPYITNVSVSKTTSPVTV